MTNWVWNELKIEKKYKNLILNSNKEVDFNILMPMPKSLDIQAGETDRLCMYWYLSDSLNLTQVEVANMPEAVILKDP